MRGMGMLVAVALVAGVLFHNGSSGHDANVSGNTSIQPRRALAAAVLDRRVYASGGWNGQTTQLDTVEVREPTTGQWAASPSLAVARSQHGMVAAGGKLWVVGGWSATTGLVSAVEMWAPGQRTWAIATNLPTPRREPAVAVLGTMIVVAGGFNGMSDRDIDGYTDRVEAYDFTTGQWRTLPSLPTPRRGLAMVTVDDALYALGGFAAEDGYLSRAERYDMHTNHWIALDWQLAPRTWAAAVVDDGAIVVIGGYDRTGVLGLVERITPSTGAICRPIALRVPRSWLAAVPIPGGMLTLGGEEATHIGGTVETITARCA